MVVFARVKLDDPGLRILIVKFLTFISKVEMMGYFEEFLHPKLGDPAEMSNVVNGKTVKLTPKESDELIKNEYGLNGPAILYGISTGENKIQQPFCLIRFPEIDIPTSFVSIFGSQFS